MKKYISDTCQVQSITDFGDLPVFKSATAYPMIFIAQNGKLISDITKFTQVKSLKSPYPDVLAVIKEEGRNLPSTAIKGSSWILTDAISANRIKKVEAEGIKLGEYAKGKICYGNKTGLTKAFVISDSKRSELNK